MTFKKGSVKAPGCFLKVACGSSHLLRRKHPGEDLRASADVSKNRLASVL
jgi:hypothetical protein